MLSTKANYVKAKKLNFLSDGTDNIKSEVVNRNLVENGKSKIFEFSIKIASN
jgi:hypothetical protein